MRVRLQLPGLQQPRHGVRHNMGFKLKADRETLASRFKRTGRASGGAVGRGGAGG